MASIRYQRKRTSLELREVLREWIRRESQKDEYPGVDLAGWERDQLVSELKTTVDEPVQYATFRSPEWTPLSMRGAELGKFDPYPSIGWNWLTGGNTLSGAVDRLQAGELESLPGPRRDRLYVPPTVPRP